MYFGHILSLVFLLSGWLQMYGILRVLFISRCLALSQCNWIVILPEWWRLLWFLAWVPSVSISLCPYFFCLCCNYHVKHLVFLLKICTFWFESCLVLNVVLRIVLLKFSGYACRPNSWNVKFCWNGFIFDK